MFCEKCGTQIAEDTKFCSKCGAKVVHKEVVQQEADSKAQELTEPVAKEESVKVNKDQKEDFREYVENHIRKTTEFQSAKELLNSKVPLRFAKISFGIPAALGAAIGILGSGNLIVALFISLFFAFTAGYLAAYIACGIVKGRYLFKYIGKFEGNIDIDDLRQFLNEHLSYLQPYFHEWGYLRREGFNIRGIVETTITEMASKAMKEVNICTEFGEKQWRLVVISIRPDKLNPDSGKMEYSFEAENRKSGSPLSSHDMGFARYKCLVQTVPILQAAMEYYIKCHKSEIES